MKNKLIFWAIYCFVIIIIALGFDTPAQKQSKVGIKQSTIYLIKQFEGFRNTAYDDGHGNMTIGVGHYIKPSEYQLYYATLSNKQVNTLLERDMRPCERVIRDRVEQPINQHQFDALMSFCHNIGQDKFAYSDVVRLINHRRYQKAADAMLNWDRPATLIGRRQKERKLFMTGA
jgi:lysozyme